MKNFKLTCAEDGFTKVVAANSLDEAVIMLLTDEDLKAHVMGKHPDMMSKSPEDMKQMIASLTKEETAEAVPMA